MEAFLTVAMAMALCALPFFVVLGLVKRERRRVYLGAALVLLWVTVTIALFGSVIEYNGGDSTSSRSLVGRIPGAAVWLVVTVLTGRYLWRSYLHAQSKIPAAVSDARPDGLSAAKGAAVRFNEFDSEHARWERDLRRTKMSDATRKGLDEISDLLVRLAKDYQVYPTFVDLEVDIQDYIEGRDERGNDVSLEIDCALECPVVADDMESGEVLKLQDFDGRIDVTRTVVDFDSGKERSKNLIGVGGVSPKQWRSRIETKLLPEIESIRALAQAHTINEN